MGNANSYITEDLPDRLIKDFFAFRIFSEADMESSAYYWLRRDHIDGLGDDWFLRRQTQIVTKSGARAWTPDILICKKDEVRAVLELKFLFRRWSGSALDDDRQKAKEYRKRFPGLVHFYQLYLYDGTPASLSDREEWMERYYSEVPINVEYRQHHDGGRAPLRRRRPAAELEDFKDEWENRRQWHRDGAAWK